MGEGWLLFGTTLFFVYLLVIPALLLSFSAPWMSWIDGLLTAHKRVRREHLADLELVNGKGGVLEIREPVRTSLLDSFNGLDFMAKQTLCVGHSVHLRFRLRNGNEILVAPGKNKNAVYVVRRQGRKETAYWGTSPSLYTYLSHQWWLYNPKPKWKRRRRIHSHLKGM
jgi:hypothetical protein